MGIVERCPKCGSGDIYFSKKKQKYICEDCDFIFSEKETDDVKQVFFSYAHDENEWLVAKLKNDVEKKGHRVWIDFSEISNGSNWRQAITEGLVKCDGVISFLSEHSMREGGVCLDEMRLAMTVRNGNVQTVLLESPEKFMIPPDVCDIKWIDMSQWKEKRLEQNSWNEWYSEKLSELLHVIEQSDFSSFAKEIDYIKSELDVFFTDAKEQLLLSRPFYGRSWLTEEVEKWIRDSRSTQILVLYGPPGIGKSAFAANCIRTNRNVIGGFFCEWDKETQKNSKYIVNSLALRIGNKIPDYRKLLYSIIQARGKHFFETLSAADLFEQLIVQPLSELIDGGRERQALIVDGLDEVGPEEQNELVYVLSEQGKRLPKWFGIIVVSRPESFIRRAFQGYDEYDLGMAQGHNREDIREYFESNLKDQLERRANRSEIIEQLLVNSEGSFLYATLFVESVKNSAIDIGNKQSFPKGLDSIHYQNFKRAFPTRESFEMPRKILEILVASASMPVGLVCRTAGVDKYEFQFFKESIGSLIAEEKKMIGKKGKECNAYSFCHKSVEDWLTNSEKSGKYYTDPKNGYKKIAEVFKTIIVKKPVSLENIDDIDTYEQYYVQRNYIDILEKDSQWDTIQSFLCEEDTPLIPYWLCLPSFPKDWNIAPLLDNLWINKDCTGFFNTLQRSGERVYVSWTLEKMKERYGIASFNQEIFETYVDIVHLGGGYRTAVKLYEEYLSSYKKEVVFTDPTLLHFSIRKIHHSMFFSPVQNLIQEALELYPYIHPEKEAKEYSELLFLLGGNLGVLSGDFQFAKTWLYKAESFAVGRNDRDNLIRVARKKADLFALDGQLEQAKSILEQYITLRDEPKSRYEIYLLGALGETFRGLKRYGEAKTAFEKLLSITKTRGLTGWQCHAELALINLLCDTNQKLSCEYKDKIKEINNKYSQLGQKWGIINSLLVELRVRMLAGTSINDLLPDLDKVKSMARELQYSYEEKIIDRIIEERIIPGYRLLFL